MGSSDQLSSWRAECLVRLTGGSNWKRQLFLVPLLSFARFLRVKLRRLDSDFDAPSLPAIRCFRSTIRLLRGRKIDEKIAMIPSASVTKSGCSGDDDLADSFPLKLSVPDERGPIKGATLTRCIP